MHQALSEPLSRDSEGEWGRGRREGDERERERGWDGGVGSEHEADTCDMILQLKAKQKPLVLVRGQSCFTSRVLGSCTSLTRSQNSGA